MFQIPQRQNIHLAHPVVHSFFKTSTSPFFAAQTFGKSFSIKIIYLPNKWAAIKKGNMIM